MNASSGSGSTSAEEWVFWKDFSKYDRSKKPRKTISTFTPDITVETRELGTEDSIVLCLSGEEVDDSSAKNTPDEAQIITPDVSSKSRLKRNSDPLASSRWKTSKRTKKSAQLEMNEFLQSLSSTLKDEESAPMSAIDHTT